MGELSQSLFKLWRRLDLEHLQLKLREAISQCCSSFCYDLSSSITSQMVRVCLHQCVCCQNFCRSGVWKEHPTEWYKFSWYKHYWRQHYVGRRAPYHWHSYRPSIRWFYYVIRRALSHWQNTATQVLMPAKLLSLSRVFFHIREQQKFWQHKRSCRQALSTYTGNRNWW